MNTTFNKPTKKLILAITGLILFVFGIYIGQTLFNNGPSKQLSSHNHESVEIYTCSMHPQIQQNEAGDCPICGMDLVLANNVNQQTTAGGLFLNARELHQAQVVSQKVKTLTASKNFSEVRLNAEIKLNEEQSFTQIAQLAGRVEKDYVQKEGVYIKKDQVIADIYSPKWIQAQRELVLALEAGDRSLVRSVEQRMRNWKVRENEIKRLKHEKEIRQIYSLKADFEGFVIAKFFKEGMNITAASTLYNGNPLTKVWVEMKAKEEELSQLQKGQQFILELNGQSSEDAIHAEIDYIAPLLDTKSRSVDVRATIENKDYRLKPEQSGFARIQVQVDADIESKTILVPKSAVLWTGERSIVYLKKEEHFYPTEVVLGTELQDRWEVLKGLSDEDEIAIQGTFTIDAAAQLAGLNSMMNRTKNPYADLQIPKERIGQIIQNYLSVKDALVLSDATKAAQYATSLITLLSKQELNSLELYDTASNFLDASTTDLTSARIALEPLTEELYLFLKTVDELPADLYYQYCPMAFNNNGAYWISNEEAIANPYFGDQMLRCGEVRDILKK